MTVFRPAVDPFARYVVDLGIDFKKQAELRAFEFQGRAVTNGVGDWTLEFTDTPPPGLDLRDINTIVVRQSGENGRNLYVGWVNPYGDQIPGLVVIYDEQGGTSYRLAGVESFGVLAQRQCWPSFAGPIRENGSLTGSTGFDLQSHKTYGPATASQVTRNLILMNLTDASGYSDATGSAPPERDTSVVACAPNPLLGDDVEYDVRFDPLHELVGELCETGGIVCYTTLDLTRGSPLWFDWRTPQDLTNTVRLKPEHMPGRVEVHYPPPRSNYVLAAGGGEGTARKFSAWSDGTSSGVNRHEVFYQSNGVNNQTTLNRTARARYRVTAQRRAVTLNTDQIPFRWDYDPTGSDYYLGDTIAFEIGDESIPMDVEGVTVDVAADRASVLPVLGAQPKNQAAKVLERINGLGLQVNGRGIA